MKDEVSFAMISAATYFWFQKLSCLLPWMILARCTSNLRFDPSSLFFYVLQSSLSLVTELTCVTQLKTVEISICNELHLSL